MRTTTRRRRGDRAGMPGKDRLIILLIPRVRLTAGGDIGGQRHDPDPRDGGVQFGARFVELEVDGAALPF